MAGGQHTDLLLFMPDQNAVPGSVMAVYKKRAGIPLDLLVLFIV